MPIERAMIETCEVLDPSAVTKPSAIPFGMRAVSEGARLRAKTTEGVVKASRAAGPRPVSSGRDLARHVAHVVGAGGEVLVVHRGELGGVLLADASTAASGLSRFRTRSSTPEASSGSSASSTWASKMPASSRCRLPQALARLRNLPGHGLTARPNRASSASTSSSATASARAPARRGVHEHGPDGHPF
jgi:hypothetical protein